MRTMFFLRIVAAIGLAFAVGFACAQTSTPPPRTAGAIELADGDTMVEDAGGRARLAKVGDNVNEADLITTFAKAELHLHMADGAYLSVRENSKLRIATYVADGGGDDRSLIDLVKGTFRSVSGWIGKHNRKNYRITAANVTIGIRGTDHEPMNLPPDDPRGEPGIYDKVNKGSSYMQTAGGGIVEVPANRVAFHPASGAAGPRLLQATPAFFKSGRHEDRFVARSREILPTLDKRRTTRQESLRSSAAVSSVAKTAPRTGRPPALSHTAPAVIPGRKSEAQRKEPAHPVASAQSKSPVRAPSVKPVPAIPKAAAEYKKVERRMERKLKDEQGTSQPRTIPHR